jgi:NAD+ kinase
MVAAVFPSRIAVVVHPSRPLDGAIETLGGWAGRHEVEVVQIAASTRRVFTLGEVDPSDLVVALGGDGTALAALRAAEPVGAPVLAVACGSVGALSAVTAGELGDALDRVRAGDWARCTVAAVKVSTPDGEHAIALNDVVLVRRGSGQLVAEVSLDGERYVRLAGDGVIVATPLGSSGYTMAAGGPLLTLRTQAFVCTPIAMHGGSAAPLVVPADSVLTIAVQPSYAGFDIELDGQRHALESHSFQLTLVPDRATLVRLSATDQGLHRLRERGLIADSPRALVRMRRGS